MSDEQHMVAAFHQAFDCMIGAYPAIPDDATCALRLTLIQEEFDELREALAQGDITDVAKELADLLYVVYGTAVSCGIDMAPVFQEVHRSNMSKVGGQKRADGKWLKPAGYQPAQLRPLLLAQGMLPQTPPTSNPEQQVKATGLQDDSKVLRQAPSLLSLAQASSGSVEPESSTCHIPPPALAPLTPARVLLSTPERPSSSALRNPAPPPPEPVPVPSKKSGGTRQHEHLPLQCPRCRKTFVQRSHRRGFTERLLSCFYVYPFRCQVCNHRFRAFRFRAHYRKRLIDRRQYVRVPTRIPVTFAESVKPDAHRTGTGMVTDLSLGGCFIQTIVRLREGALLSLVLQIDDHSPVLTVEAALVRSTRPLGVGLEFLRLAESEQERLSTLVRHLHAEQDERTATQQGAGSTQQ
ncbi:MAG: PilZ domain-containing protein [Candidatus Tectimicrobiota bacterium]